MTIIYMLTFHLMMLSGGTDYWTHLLFCSQPVSAGQMEWGDGTEAWEVPLTLFPSPSAAPTTCHTHHGPDPSSTLTGAHLPSSPPEQQGALPCQLCSTACTTVSLKPEQILHQPLGDFSFIRVVILQR